MIEVVIIIACIAISLACIVTMNYLGRVDDWLSDLYDNQRKIITQNANIQRQLNTIINANSEGLEFMEIKKRN